MFLSDKELAELTGFKLGKKQCEWLDSHGWVYEPDAHGKPRVLVEYCRMKMGISGPQPKRWELDLSSV